MSISWELGTFKISTGRRPGEPAQGHVERWEAEGRPMTAVEGLVGGPFGIHQVMGGDWTLSEMSNGFRICDAESVVDALKLADRLADLDWSGSPAEIAARNGPAVNEAWKEFGV